MLLRLILLASVLTGRLATAQTTTQLLQPSYGGKWDHAQVSASANQLRCVRGVAPFSISGATKLSVYVTINVGGTTVGYGIYPDGNSSTALATTTGSSATTGVKTGTVSSFSLTAGTTYRWCTCSDSASVQVVGISLGGTSGRTFYDLLNAGGTRVATAANSCSTGTPPSTTGALTTASVSFEPLILVE